MTDRSRPRRTRLRILAALKSIGQNEFTAADLPYLVLEHEQAPEVRDEPGWSIDQMRWHTRHLIDEGLLTRRTERGRYYYRVAGDQK